MNSYKNVSTLSEIDFVNKDKVSLTGTIIDIYSEGSFTSGGKRTPIKLLLKLENTGELLLATSWVPEMLTTIKEGKNNIKVYNISGYCSIFNDAKQISIDELRYTGEDSTQKYLSKGNSENDGSELNRLVETHITNHIFKAILNEMVLSSDNFKTWPAASRMHHAFTGGLLKHTLGVAKNALSFAEHYENIDKELVLTGAILHDIGKLYEYTATGERTFEGDLFGHLYMGAKVVEDFVKERFPDLDEESSLKVKLLSHIILSHHENMEWGAVAKPFILEAYVVARSDATDALFEEVIEGLNMLNPGQCSIKAIPGTENRIFKKPY